jgi:signal transduction histidine kinase/ActR/RegA family two-component response regulator
MSRNADAGRAKLLRLLMTGVAAAVALMIAVGGMVAYSAHVVDRLQARFETRLVARRIDHTLTRLREDVVSATVWNDADVHTRAADKAWMQVNYGDYYADYMHHDVTVAFAGDGRLIYASRRSEQVDPTREAAFAGAVAPLVAQARVLATARRHDAQGRRVAGLKAGATRGGIVMVENDPYFVIVSNVVPEDVAHITSETPDPLVASGMKASTVVAAIGDDLGLNNSRLYIGRRPPAPRAPLPGPDGKPLGWIGWIPANPGASVLVSAAPPLAIVLAIALAALAYGAVQARRLVRDLADNERALADSLKTARAANEAKSQFLANMSHELRTPLNGMVAMTELLHERQDDERSREMTRTILASSRMLERVVNDVLDVSRIEAGQLRFEIAPFDAGELMRQIVGLHAATAQSKQVRLDLEVAPTAEGVYAGDATRVGQIVSNLVGNAVKFTDAGLVRVLVRHGATGLRIAVADSGIGFERAHASRLFQRFEQADASMNRRYGGAGLGLSICLSLARMMGGRLQVRSSPGKGSLFIVTLPLPRLGERLEAAANEAVAAPKQFRGFRVLIADDHEVNRRIVAMVLEPLGMELVMAANGAEALDAALAERFDLILMDVQMPVMDGLTATRKLREAEQAQRRRPTPVIALTAHAMPEDVVRSLDAGADLHMTKPIRPSVLIRAAGEILAGRSAA